jgi:hypothetical protein
VQLCHGSRVLHDQCPQLCGRHIALQCPANQRLPIVSNERRQIFGRDGATRRIRQRRQTSERIDDQTRSSSTIGRWRQRQARHDRRSLRVTSVLEVLERVHVRNRDWGVAWLIDGNAQREVRRFQERRRLAGIFHEEHAGILDEALHEHLPVATL